jgi:hypothetical protein
MLGNRFGPGLQYRATLNSTDSDCAFLWGDIGYKEQHIAGYIVGDDVTTCNPNGTHPHDQEWRIFVAHVELDNVTRTFNASGLELQYRDGQWFMFNPYARRRLTTLLNFSGEHSVSIITCQPKIELRKALVVSDGETVNATLIGDGAALAPPNISAWDVLHQIKQSEFAAGPLLSGPNMMPLPDSNNVTVSSDFIKR